MNTTDYSPKRNVTICLVIDDGKVLLGMKEKGFGAGWWNGPGGKQELGETIENAAARELEAECGLIADKDDLKKVAEIDFVFLTKPKWNQRAFVFLLKRAKCRGELKESNEMKIFKWFDELPDEMWPADKYWMPRVRSGEIINQSQIVFSDTNGNPAKVVINGEEIKIG